MEGRWAEEKEEEAKEEDNSLNDGLQLVWEEREEHNQHRKREVEHPRQTKRRRTTKICHSSREVVERDDERATTEVCDEAKLVAMEQNV